MQEKQIKKVEQQEQPKTMNDIMMDLFKSEGSDIKAQKINEYLNALYAMGIGRNLSPEHMYIFLKYCYTLGLNPLLKQIHCITHKDNKTGEVIVTPVISYMEYVKKAAKHPDYQLPQMDIVDRDIHGKPLGLNDIYIDASVQRKGDTLPFKKRFYMREWKRNTPMWNQQPINMLYVRAMKNILSLAYPAEIGDLEVIEAAGEAAVCEIEANKKETTKTNFKEIMDEQH